MRIAHVVSLAGLAGAVLGGLSAAGDDDKSRPAAEVRATQADADAIAAAVKHFTEQDVVWAFDGREAKTVVLVNRESAGPRSLSDAQLEADLRNDKWAIAAAVADDLRRRNAKAVPLGDLKFGERVLVADLKKVPPNLDAKEPPKAYAAAKAYAHVWLPGYSADGATAVVRFVFGPTPHGATATYLLAREKGVWTVKKWSHTYYV